MLQIILVMAGFYTFNWLFPDLANFISKVVWYGAIGWGCLFVYLIFFGN